jgi:hypothetical protein
VPASFAVAPGGSVMSTPFSSCWPSVRLILTWKGVKVAALSLFGLATKPGANGRSPRLLAQGPPPGALLSVKPASWGPRSGVPDQALKAWVVLLGPQVGGLVRAPLAPSNWILTEVNGTCGLSAKVVVSCPVRRLALTWPTRRTSTP